MPAVFIVFAKEIIDNLRDKRSMAMALIYPLIGPILLGTILNAAGASLTVDKDRPFLVFVEGAENAPALITFLEEKGATIKKAPENKIEQVQSGRLPLVLIVDPPERADASAGPLRLQLRMIVDAGRLSNAIPMARVSSLITEFSRDMTRARLDALGLPEEVTEPVVLQRDNVGRSLSLGSFFVNMIPPFLMFTIFIGGVYLALDTTSGERERGSLEPLMINPVPRWQFLSGKILAAFLFTVAAVAIQILAFKVMIESVPENALGIVDRPGFTRLGFVFLACLPIAIFAVVTQVIIASLTRSMKEAQAYLGLLPLIPAAPGMVMVFVQLENSPVLSLIPTFGQTILIGQLIRGDSVTPALALLSSFSTIAVAALLLVVAVRLYNREKLLFVG